MKASAHGNSIGPLERLVFLKSLGALGQVALEELASIAEYLEERTYRKGSELISASGPPEEIHWVVSGRTVTNYQGVPVAYVEPPFASGFLGYLARCPSGYEVVAEVDTHTLTIKSDILFDIFEDYFDGILLGLRQLSKQLLAVRERLPVSDEPVPVEHPDFGFPKRPLDLVQRLLWLTETSAVFANSNLDAVMQIARNQTEKRWQPGERIWSTGEHADYGLSILYGNVRCWGDEGQRSFTAGSGFSLGHLNAMAEQPRNHNAEAVTEVVALVDYTADVVDVLEDNTDLALGLSGNLAANLLELYSVLGPE